MKISPLIIAGVSAQTINIDDYPNIQFLGCKNGKAKIGKEITIGNGTNCKFLRCKYVPKHKAKSVTLDNLPEEYIVCPSLAESGCPTEWGVRYVQGKRKFELSSHDIVPANGIKDSSKTGKLTATCLNTGAVNKAKCMPKTKAAAKPGPVTFEWKWDKNQILECEGRGQGWAQWEQWSGANNSSPDCKPQTVSRSRMCLDGPHPGRPTACGSVVPKGTSSEVKNFWPKSCKKCHADLGMMYTPGTLNIPKLPLPNVLYDHLEDKFDDGFVLEGQGVVKMRCHDQSEYSKPYKQTCKCDQNGCHLGDADLCQGQDYKGYGHDYLWMPGAKDTFKSSSTAEFSTVNVEPDFTITYNNLKKEPDERFVNRVKWWEPNGPSICRFFNKYAYLPGIERPKLRNDDGSLDFDFFNWLECDNYIYNFPSITGNPTTGAVYYEVLTSDKKMSWTKAEKLTSEEIQDKMIVVGTYANSDKTFHGLCRMKKCTLRTDPALKCVNKVVNDSSQEMFENMPVYPGLLHWSNKDKKWKCQNLLVTHNIAESFDTSAFEVLVKA